MAFRPPKAAPVDYDEVLLGSVNGEKASDLEQRFARGLDKKGIAYDFQPSFIAGKNKPGEIRLDFMVYVGGMMYPTQIDGEFTHGSAEQQGKDKFNDAVLDDWLKDKPALPVKRVSGKDLQNQEDADTFIEENYA